MSKATALPSGTVTFLLTDIEGSTRLWEQHPDTMRLAVARHEALAAGILSRHGGTLVKPRGEGDSLFAVFARATDAVTAACALQQVFHAEPWPGETPLRVRVALHTGEAELREGDYYGPAVNRCARLRAAAHGGQVLLSGATQGLVQDDLPADASLLDLGLHRLRDLERTEHVFQLLHPELPAEFPSPRSLDALPNNLPQQVTSFIGREREMEDVQRLLGVGQAVSLRGAAGPQADSLPHCRLVTITGAGGTGKTRLSLQVAAELLHEFPDGVWLVELASLSDPALVLQTVAAAVGVREQPGKTPLEALLEALKPRELLLLLDNCEHLLDACARLAEALLRHCPHAHLLANSREGLNIPGETTYRLPSLSTPDVAGVRRQASGVSKGSENQTDVGPSDWRLTPDASHLLQYEAVRLFIDRAVAAVPSFTLTNHNAPAVAQVCHRLDGIPLAIELAAARVKALPVEKIADRLDDRFRLLTGGSRTALPRQQTLRALIDWSYDLLQEPERALLRRLSVFWGGWTLEAAEAVCGDPADGGAEGVGNSGAQGGSRQSAVSSQEPSGLPTAYCLLPTDVLDLLTHLVDKSLVVYEEQEGEARYRLLETVRQYARDRLLESGEAEAVRDRHREFFLQLAERAGPELEGSEQVMWLERLEAEHDNLRAALAWCQEAEAGLRMALALMAFWDARGYRLEGQEALRQILERGGVASSILRARAMRAAGFLAIRLGEYGPARSLLEESLTLFRGAGDRRGVAATLQSLAQLEGQQGHLEAARAHLEECLRLRQEDVEKLGLAGTLNSLGKVRTSLGDYTGARACLEECLALHRKRGNRRGIAIALVNLADLAMAEGDDTAARRLLDESLAAYREVGDQGGVAYALGSLSEIAYRQDDYERAATLSQESVRLWREIGERNYLAGSLVRSGRIALAQGDPAKATALGREGLEILCVLEDLGRTSDALGFSAQLAARRGQAARAARLWGAAAALREATGAAPQPEQPEGIDAVRAGLGEEAFAAAWEEGRAMSLQEAIGYALQDEADRSLAGEGERE